MIAAEAILWFAILVTVGVIIMGRPLSEAYAERIKAKYRGITEDDKEKLQQKVAGLEQEVMDLKKQISQAQETAEFACKLIEGNKTDLQKITNVLNEKTK